MTFTVAWSDEAEEDLQRLADFILDRAQYVEDLDQIHHAMVAIRSAAEGLSRGPLLYRRAAGRDPLRRELVVPFGAQGYVLAYEIASPALVVVLAVRHQRQQDTN